MKNYQIHYNDLLKRYNKGITYLLTHKEERDKWLPELISIVDELGKMVKENNIQGENILNGFKEE